MQPPQPPTGIFEDEKRGSINNQELRNVAAFIFRTDRSGINTPWLGEG